jgi:3-oxoacyl-[acyl-carrier-protein] synthase II
LLERRLSGSAPGPGFVREYSKGCVVDEVAQALQLTGPRQSINTACSSGAVAIAIASDWLRDGDVDWAIAVGSDELGRFTYSGFHALRAMDPEMCRPFDKARRGLTMGEGAGCLVLERIDDAARRRTPELGRVCSVGHTCDSHHLTAPDPSGVGQARAMRVALELAGLGVDDVGFVNAHGTGTPLNDAAEVASLELGLGSRAASCPVHSVKATIGHCMGAAGAIEAVVALKSLHLGLVPHTAGLVDSEFEGRVNCVSGAPQAVQCDYAMSTSFGFGGNDAAVVLRRGEGWS